MTQDQKDDEQAFMAYHTANNAYMFAKDQRESFERTRPQANTSSTMGLHSTREFDTELESLEQKEQQALYVQQEAFSYFNNRLPKSITSMVDGLVFTGPSSKGGLLVIIKSDRGFITYLEFKNETEVRHALIAEQQRPMRSKGFFTR